MIIWGNRSERQFQGFHAVGYCPICRGPSVVGIIEHKRRFTLYFIPTFSYGREAEAVCGRCGWSGRAEILGPLGPAITETQAHQMLAAGETQPSGSAPSQAEAEFAAAWDKAVSDLARTADVFRVEAGQTGERLLADIGQPWAVLAGSPSLLVGGLSPTYGTDMIEGVFQGLRANDITSVGKVISYGHLKGRYLALMRLHRENIELGRRPPHAWQDGSWEDAAELSWGLETWEAWRFPWTPLTRREWLHAGALPPFTNEVIRGAIVILTNESAEAINLFLTDPADRLIAFALLLQQVVLGYASGRSHQERQLMHAFA